MPLDALIASLRPGGGDFERLCKWLLENAPEYRSRLTKVWLWQDWPGRWGADAGIDLVAEDRDGGFWAVQAKHYDPVEFPWPPGTNAPPLKEGDYRPIGAGLAIPAGPLTAILTCPAELQGLVLEFDMRGDRLACVAVSSPADGPDITSTALRKLGPVLRSATRKLFEGHVVRVTRILDDGTAIGDFAWRRITEEGVDVGIAFGRVTEDVSAEFERTRPRRGRPPLSEAHLERVAELYVEAETQDVPRTEYISRHIPGYSDETVRNWVRIARDRQILGPAEGKRATPKRRGEPR